MQLFIIYIQNKYFLIQYNLQSHKKFVFITLLFQHICIIDRAFNKILKFLQPWDHVFLKKTNNER